MKKLMMIAATALLATSFAKVNGQDGDKTIYTIDTQKSIVLWKGEKLTGEENGTLELKGGTVTVKGESVMSTDLVIDMTSIVATDIEDKVDNGKLVGHLKSDDFFSVEKNPTATFKATSFKAIKGVTNGAPHYMVTGELTIKGITNTINFPAMVVISNGMLTANATSKFDRTKWDIKYGSGSFFEGLGDRVIYDDVTFEFQLVANASK